MHTHLWPVARQIESQSMQHATRTMDTKLISVTATARGKNKTQTHFISSNSRVKGHTKKNKKTTTVAKSTAQ